MATDPYGAARRHRTYELVFAAGCLALTATALWCAAHTLWPEGALFALGALVMALGASRSGGDYRTARARAVRNESTPAGRSARTSAELGALLPPLDRLLRARGSMLEHWADAGDHPDDGAWRKALWTELHRAADEVEDTLEALDAAAVDTLTSGRAITPVRIVTHPGEQR